jgi:hypothetical protein
MRSMKRPEQRDHHRLRSSAHLRRLGDGGYGKSLDAACFHPVHHK